MGKSLLDSIWRHSSRDITNILSASGSFILGWSSFRKSKAVCYESMRHMYRWFCNVIKHRLVTESYNGKKILDYDEANKVIADAIESGRPFMAGKYGFCELNAMWRVRDDGKGFIAPMSQALHMMHYNAGFFPEDKNLLIKFSEIMKQSTSQVDLMAIWFNVMESYEIKTYGNNPDFCPISGLSPLASKEPWTAKLEGKKVLVIHPFYNTIREQYKKRELLFPGTNILPKFELAVQQAVQTIAGNKDERFKNWFEALDYMYNEAMTKDFDVAIIGCGAYGFPLAAKIKEAGKIAIHLGADTQLLFGIKGKRWEDRPTKQLFNEHWVSPMERPEGYQNIEGGCYW